MNEAAPVTANVIIFLFLLISPSLLPKASWLPMHMHQSVCINNHSIHAAEQQFENSSGSQKLDERWDNRRESMGMSKFDTKANNSSGLWQILHSAPWPKSQYIEQREEYFTMRWPCGLLCTNWGGKNPTMQGGCKDFRWKWPKSP